MTAYHGRFVRRWRVSIASKSCSLNLLSLAELQMYKPRDLIFITDLDAGTVCQLELDMSLRRCNGFLTEILMSTLYYVAIAFRLLDPDELFDVVEFACGLHASPNAGSVVQGDFESSLPDRDSLLRLCSRLLMVGADGRVDFRERGMRGFLLQSQGSEFESGHERMAHACHRVLLQEADWLIFRPWTNF